MPDDKKPGKTKFRTAPASKQPPQTYKSDGGETMKDNVVGLFPDAKDDAPPPNKGGIVPQGGVMGVGTDDRVRVRIRPGKRWSEIITAVKDGEYTWDEFVTHLSPTELARGQLKDKHGNFTGRPAAMVPRAFHEACVRELMKRGQTLYRENYLEAIQAMTGIAKDVNVKESDRIKAAQFVIERLEGKVPEKLEISAADPWQTIVTGIVASAEDDAIANAQSYLERME